MENAPRLSPVDETTTPEASVRKARLSRRTWIVLAAAVLVAGGAAYGIPTAVGAVEHQAAVDRFESVVADRSAAYKAQDQAIEQLHTMEDLATTTYPQYLAIGTTLTDTTVTDPALRADLLTKTSELATSALALDEAGALDVERPSLFTGLVPSDDMPLKGVTAPAQTEEVNALTGKLAKDASAVLEYIDLVSDVTDGIIDAADAVANSADAVIASAGEKGVTLTWEKAPAETAAVTAAGAAHQAVLDQEAEAARQAAAAEAERQAAAQRPRNTGGGGEKPSSRGSSGGGSPSTRPLPPGGGYVGDPNKKDTSNQCWTSNGAGGTMPCGGW